MISFKDRVKNLKLKYNKTRQLTSETFNEVLDLIGASSSSNESSTTKWKQKTW